MQQALISLALSGLGRDAARAAAGLAAAVLLVALCSALSFVSLVGALLDAALPGSPVMGTSPATFGASALSALSASSDTALAMGGESGAEPASDAAAVAVALARGQLGRPYVWGGATLTMGFDCSGLTQWSFAQAGVRLPRTAQQQFDATRRLAPSELRRGDLVFFAHTYEDPHDWVTHVGLYLGGGLMVDAEDAGISVSPVFTGYWGAHYAGAGHVAATGSASRGSGSGSAEGAGR